MGTGGDGTDCPEPLGETTYVVPDWIVEYRYDGDRGRYLTRPRDPETFEPLATLLEDDSYDHWTEYVNDLVHRDLEVDKGDGSVSTMKRYVHAGIPGADGSGLSGVGPALSRSGGLGYGLVAQYGVSGSETRFFHSDLVGTTRLTTDSGGAIQTRLRWTAFGEPLPLVVGEPPYGYEQPSGAETRYGYAGSWGYQNDGLAGNPPSGATLDTGLLHVGARYYEPAIGRFVMRDPIGIDGGLNVYGYCDNNPLMAVDAEGLFSYADITAAQGRIQQMLNAQLPGLRASFHLAKDMLEKALDVMDLVDALTNGPFFYDTAHDNYVALGEEVPTCRLKRTTL